MPRQLKPCGTHAAYKRHLAHGETPCQACRDAATAVKRALRGNRPRRVAQCGTNSGYVAHFHRHEPYCDACREAHSTYERERRLHKSGARPARAATAQPAATSTHDPAGNL